MLPSVDKLTPESDFTGFMHPKVEDALRRVALKKLFSDPHFNVPDPFEAYSRRLDRRRADSAGDAGDAQPGRSTDLRKEGRRRTEAVAEEPTEKQTKHDEPGKQDA